MNCINVIAGLIEKDGRILIGRRKKQAFLGGKWEFPGGKLETNETPEQCLKRELLEELGIETEIGEFFFSTVHPLDCRTLIELSVYRVNHISGEFKLYDHEEIRWVKKSELNQYDFPDADYAVLKKLMKDTEDKRGTKV